MDIRAFAEANREYIIGRRRYFHQHPELSFKEWETTKTLKAELEAMGMEIQTFEDYPGLIATMDTGKPGRHRCTAGKRRHRPGICICQ